MPLHPCRPIGPAFAALALAFATQAVAKDVCDHLRSRITGAPAVAGDPETRPYASAIDRQQMRLRQAEADLENLGCSSGSVTIYRMSNARDCAAIRSAIERMQRNLLMLEQRQVEIAGVDPDTRVRIVAEMEANGCDVSGLPASVSADRLRPPGPATSVVRENVGSVTTIRIRPLAPVAVPEKTIVERLYDPVKDKVRTVGPVFLPDEEPRIDLRHPAGSN
ncbi:hypothetical protein [Mycoplana dimorpha]|uniref:Uncharacterized protein n=1 Tax=Mycoplana dimorpha TaxID=28320 RepID=A0A2T5B8S9_MYCDI|nr:hypothetical protein [Mycoplana dimorpha]PTM95313.1 hypothetical protein C7449_104390 [Mycoplana dimorpha]